jgi:hypothetical protein
MPTSVERVATLWQLAWADARLACVIYRERSGFLLCIESATAVVITERFELQPRALARANGLRDGLRRRGWRDLDADSGG